LLGESSALNEDRSEQNESLTPEIYFGSQRLQHLVSSQQASQEPREYSLPASQGKSTFALEGRWEFDGERARLSGKSGKIRLHFDAKSVFMVAKAAPGSSVTARVGDESKIFQVFESKLYTLFEAQSGGARVLELEIEGEGFEIFTFTFG
jgi:hypothetical protein